MKILYYGGQKSGKSLLAEQKALALSKATKPCYIATYDAHRNTPKTTQRALYHHRRDFAS